MWHWRYELGLIAGVLLGTIGIGVTLGPGWLIAAAAALAVMAAALTWPPSRQRIAARDLEAAGTSCARPAGPATSASW